MKLAYERPVMRAEAFRTNAYCFGCDTDNDGSATGMNNLKVGEAGSWWSIPSSYN